MRCRRDGLFVAERNGIALGYRKIAATPAFADSAVALDRVTEDLLEHALFHGADIGMILGDLVVRACIKGEGLLRGSDINGNAAGFHHLLDIDDTTGKVALDAVLVVLGESLRDTSEQAMQCLAALLPFDFVEQYRHQGVVTPGEELAGTFGQ